MDFFDDEDDASSSDQPTRESRSIRDSDFEPEPEAGDPEPRRRAPRDRPRPRPRSSARERRSARPPRGGGGGDGTSRQQIRSRQLTLIGVAIVVLILLFLAFKGCLNARKERAFKNYVSDLSALTVETKQLSDQFFSAFEGDSQDGDIGLTNEVNGDRGTAQGLLDRAEGLDAPGELSSAQSQVALSYRLRRDALEAIAQALPDAQGDGKQAQKAAKNIEQQMRVLLASDVLYSRAQFEIEQALENQEIVVDDGVPKSQFLPDDPNFLDLSTVQGFISGSGGGGGGNPANCDTSDGSLHGLELSSTTAQPEGTVLQPDGVANTVTADGTEFEIAVQNQGETAESNIGVKLGGDFSGQQTISSIEPGEIATVTIPPKPAPTAGDTASLEVTVDTVCGEELDTNNTSTYDITFG